MQIEVECLLVHNNNSMHGLIEIERERGKREGEREGGNDGGSERYDNDQNQEEGDKIDR